MKKNVIIVEPQSASANVFSLFSYLPLMGPLYLGTTLKNAGFNVQVLNENILKRKLHGSELDADFLLLSCLTPTVNRGYQLALEFKAANPNGKVIIGGPHVSFLKEEAMEYADHVVIGEGENIIVDLLTHGSDEMFVEGSPVKDMDSLPFVDWTILAGHKKGNIMPIMTSRGCPFACNFCSVAEMFGRKYRAMSPERVIEEVKQKHKKFIFFYDDNFTADTKRAHAIMDGMIKIGVKPKAWTAQVRSDVCRDLDLVDKMSRAGCDRVYIGFESINPVTLKKYKKSQTPEDVLYAIQTLHKNNIAVHGMFMYGADSDDAAVVRETSDFVKKTRVDSVQFMVQTPFPGTELFRQIDGDGRLIHRNWEYYDGLHVVFWPENFTPHSLQSLAMDSFEGFYSLTSAANEVINVFADKTVSAFGWVSERSKIHTFSFKNAFLKAGGRLILNKWNRVNESYVHYLEQVSKNNPFRRHLLHGNPESS